VTSKLQQKIEEQQLIEIVLPTNCNLHRTGQSPSFRKILWQQRLPWRECGRLVPDDGEHLSEMDPDWMWIVGESWSVTDKGASASWRFGQR
jgi:hypothetical protein